MHRKQALGVSAGNEQYLGGGGEGKKGKMGEKGGGE